MSDKKHPVILDKDNRLISPQKNGRVSTCEENRYEIKVLGHLDEHWSERLGYLCITHDAQGNTVISGIIQDQAALHGILLQIRDLGLILISLMRG